MQTFAIKHRAQLTWEDLPFVEAPVFAHTHIMQMLNNPNHLWMRIENLPEFIRTEIGSYSSLRNHDYAKNQIERLIGSGLYFNICRTGKPFCAAFTWQEDPEHPHKGFWTDPLNYYWRASVAIKNQLMLIANQWHRLQTQNNSDESSLDEWISKTGTVAYAADPFTAKGMSSGYALSSPEQLKYISPVTEKSEIEPVDYLGIVDDTLKSLEASFDEITTENTPQSAKLSRLLKMSAGLKVGSTGSEVIALQKELGFEGDDLDGKFGNGTNRALQAKISDLKEYQSNLDLLNDPKVDAFLWTLGKFESGNRPNVITGGKKFESYDDHPRIKVWFDNGKGSKYFSTAAGNFQMISSTWDTYQEKYELADFSLANQKQATLGLMRKYGVIDALNGGDINLAIYRAGAQWDAFPKGENELSMTNANRPLKPILDIYNNRLGELNESK